MVNSYSGILGDPSVASVWPKTDRIAFDIAWHIDGGYSFKPEVRHWPRLFLPIDCPLVSPAQSEFSLHLAIGRLAA